MDYGLCGFVKLRVVFARLWGKKLEIIKKKANFVRYIHV